jgi:hypothetical protein
MLVYDNHLVCNSRMIILRAYVFSNLYGISVGVGSDYKERPYIILERKCMRE